MAPKKKAIVKTGSRRKKAETKAEKVETSVKEAGALPLLAGNMPPIKDLLYHLETIAGYQAKAAFAAGKVSEAKKKAKDAGVDLKSISLTMGFEKLDALDLATLLRQLQALMNENGLPVQIQLFEPSFGTPEEMAAHEGWTAGKAGRTPDTQRWIEGTPAHTAYMRRWNDGTKDNIQNGAGEPEED